MNLRRSILLASVLSLSFAVAFTGCKAHEHPATPTAHAKHASPSQVALAPVASTRPTTSPAEYREAEQLKPILGYLASDELEGRGLQTEGINKAADFVAKQFKDTGLRPMPALDQSYFQPFDVTVNTTIGDKTELTLASQRLKLDDDYRPLGFSGEGSFDAPVVFAGYSISSEKYKYDDFAGAAPDADVKGKVVLAPRYEP